MYMSAIIIYYSLTGNTELLANLIAKETKADLYSLKPLKPYPDKGPFKMIIGGHDALTGKEPKLSEIPDISKYDTIFLGSPIWAGTFSPPIKSFLKSVDMSGKNVLIFLTLMGKNSDGCIEKLKKEIKNCQIENTLTVSSPQKTDVNELLNKVRSFVSSSGII